MHILIKKDGGEEVLMKCWIRVVAIIVTIVFLSQELVWALAPRSNLGEVAECLGVRSIAGCLATDKDINWVLSGFVNRRYVIDYYFEEGNWVPYRVDYIRNYDKKENPIDKEIREFHELLQLSSDEQRRLNETLSSLGYDKLKKPLRIRVVLGESSVALKEELEKTAFVHVGERAGRIWFGEMLFRDILRNDTDPLRERIFRHEKEHLLGNHDVDKETEYAQLVMDVAKKCREIDREQRDGLMERFLRREFLEGLTNIRASENELFYKDRVGEDGRPVAETVEGALDSSSGLIQVLIPFDTPGSGILTRHIRDLAQNRLRNNSGIILFPIDMRKVYSIDTLTGEILREIGSISNTDLDRLLRTGGLVLVLEGLDRMPVERDKMVNVYNYLKRINSEGVRIVIVSDRDFFEKTIGQEETGITIKVRPLAKKDVKKILRREAYPDLGKRLVNIIDKLEFKDMWEDTYLRKVLIYVLYNELNSIEPRNLTPSWVLEKFISYWYDGYKFKAPRPEYYDSSGWGSMFQGKEEFDRFFGGFAYALWLEKEGQPGVEPAVSYKRFNAVYKEALGRSVPNPKYDCYSDEFKEHLFVKVVRTQRDVLYGFSHPAILYHFLRKFAASQGLDVGKDLDNALRGYRDREKGETQRVYTWDVPGGFMSSPYPVPESVFTLKNLLRMGLLSQGAVFKLSIEGKLVKAVLTEDGKLEVRGKLFNSFSEVIDAILNSIGDKVSPMVLTLQNRPVEELWSYNGKPISKLREEFYKGINPHLIKRDVSPAPKYPGLGIDPETSEALKLFSFHGSPDFSNPFNPESEDRSNYVILHFDSILKLFRQRSIVGDEHYIAWQLARPLSAEEIMKRENTIQKGFDELDSIKHGLDHYFRGYTKDGQRRIECFKDIFFYGDQSEQYYTSPVLDYRNFFNGFTWLRDTLNILSTHGTDWERLAQEMNKFMLSEAYRELSGLVSSYGHKIPQGKWKEWSKAVEKYKEDIYKLWFIIQDTSFYAAAGEVAGAYFCSRTNWNPNVRDIVLNGGRNPGLLEKYDYSGLMRIVPNDIHLDRGSHNLIITGANGAGKTQFIKMLATNIFMAHRGLLPFSEYMEMPYMEYMAVSLDTSRHGTAASSFQNEIYRINDIIRDFNESGARNGIIFLDEPFKGTASRDAIPLIIGLLRYFQERGVYVVISTHFTELKDYLESMKDAPTCEFVKFEGKGFLLKKGMGKSYGLRTARQFGMPLEILETAQKVIDGGDLAVGEKPIGDKPEHLQIGSMKDTKDFGIGTDKYTGEALGIFKDNYVLTPNYSDSAFAEMLFQGKGRKERIEVIGQLLGDPDSRTILRDIIKRYFYNFDTVFNYTPLPLIGGDRAKEYHAFQNAVNNTFSMGEYMDGLAKLIDALARFSVFNELTDDLRGIKGSDAWRSLREFVAKNTGQLEIGFSKGATTWEGWRGLLNTHKKEIEGLEDILFKLNFYIAVTSTIDQYKMVMVTDSEDGSGINIQKGWSTILKGTGKDVVPSDVKLDPRVPITIISGTNAGGKTHYLLEIANSIFLSEQIGYIPAISGSMPHITFLGGTINASKETDRLSSFETEVERIAEVVKNYESAGFPSGGVVIFDEPFRGTNSADACPLIIGLLHYFQKRGVQVVITTHFSELFSYLGLAKGLNWKGIYFDNLSDESTPYIPYSGQGRSDGVEVFKRMGGIREIWDVAKTVQGVVVRKAVEEEKESAALDMDNLWASEEEFVVAGSDEAIYSAGVSEQEAYRRLEANRGKKIKVTLKTGEVVEGVLNLVNNPYFPFVFIEGKTGISLKDIASIELVPREPKGSPAHFFRVLAMGEGLTLEELNTAAEGIGFKTIRRDLLILIRAGLVQRIAKGFRISPDLLASTARMAIAQAVLDEEFEAGKIERHMRNRVERDRIIKKLIKEVWGIDIDIDIIPHFYRIKEDVYNLSFLLSNAVLREGRRYTIRYDRERLRGYEEIIEDYVRILKQHVSNPEDVKVIASDGRGEEGYLVKVTCITNKGERIGEGMVDVAISGGIKDYRLHIIGMLNIALASSNIPEGLTSDGINEYEHLVRFIESQYRAILGKGLVIPDNPDDINRMIRRIVLDLPKSHRISPEEFQKFNNLTREVLMSA